MGSGQHDERVDTNAEQALDEADSQAQATALRYAHDEVFGAAREGLRGGRIMASRLCPGVPWARLD